MEITGNATEAYATIAIIKKLASEEKIIPPKYLMTNLFAFFYYNLYLIEELLGSNKKLPGKLLRETKKIGRKMVSNSKNIAYDRTEAYRLMGTFYWYTGRQKTALSWWKRSIDIGERMEGRLELSRSYFEVGKRCILLQKEDAGRHLYERSTKLIGITPEECIARAEAMFREMDLQWDLEQLSHC